MNFGGKRVYQESTSPVTASHSLLRLPYVIETLGFVASGLRFTSGTRMVCESHAVQLVGEQRSTRATSRNLQNSRQCFLRAFVCLAAGVFVCGVETN